MKQLLSLLVAALISVAAIAQPFQTYIEVQGQTTYQKTADKYQAVLEISTGAATGYYPYEEDKPALDTIEAQIFEKLEVLGFNQNQFVKKSSKDDHRQSTTDRNYYVFETASKEEYTRFVTMRNIKGTYILDKKVFYQPLENREKLIAEALENARKNAAITAKAMGKTLGGILSVTDYNVPPSDDKSTYYPSSENTTYRLVVRFEVK